jgi:RNA polymerase sigma-70 factor, ECF subfamily
MSKISQDTTDDAPLGLTFDERTLIERIQNGRVALFSELIGRYQDRMYNLAYRLMGTPEDAADLTQEAFLRALRSIGQFRGDARFSTWLIKIMMNITNDWKSRACKERDQREQMQALLQRSQASAMISESEPEANALKHEMVDLLWQAIDVMDLKYKQMLLLRDLEQMSYQEIASILKLSEGTVKSRLFRARENLRELLEPVLHPKIGEAK